MFGDRVYDAWLDDTSNVMDQPLTITTGDRMLETH